jgi:hypothetical protein
MGRRMYDIGDQEKMILRTGNRVKILKDDLRFAGREGTIRGVVGHFFKKDGSPAKPLNNPYCVIFDNGEARWYKESEIELVSQGTQEDE